MTDDCPQTIKYFHDGSNQNPSNGASISHTSPWSQPFPEQIYNQNGWAPALIDYGRGNTSLCLCVCVVFSVPIKVEREIKYNSLISTYRSYL